MMGRRRDIHELRAELDGLRELLLEKIEACTQVIDERDRLYRERDDSRRTAVDAALTAVKEQTKASFEASEKAIVKAEEAQKSYNQTHNDLARKMDDQNKGTMPRPEAEQRFHSIQEKIDALKDFMSTSSGSARGGKEAVESGRAWILAAVSVAGFALMLLWKLMGR